MPEFSILLPDQAALAEVLERVEAAGVRLAAHDQGWLADGLLVSTAYVPPEKLPDLNCLIDDGAAQAGRPPTAIRRGYNLMGVLDLGRTDTKLPTPRPGLIYGSPDHWVTEILRFHRDYRQHTFIFWQWPATNSCRSKPCEHPAGRPKGCSRRLFRAVAGGSGS